MTSSIEPEQSADELAISGLDDEIWNIKTRVKRNPGYGCDLGTASLKLLSEIWSPPATDDETRTYIATVSSGIDRIPVELLNELSGKLSSAAENESAAEQVARDAFNLLAGWLKARSMELSGDASIRMSARQLKIDHSLLLDRLLLKGKSAATPARDAGGVQDSDPDEVDRSE